MAHQYTQKAPILAPNVWEELDENGNFVTRWSEGQRHDINGDPIYDDDD